MENFHAKNVLITGATGNLGEAVARAFLERGASLALTDRNPERLRSTYADVPTGQVLFVAPVDMADAAQVEQLFATVKAHWDRLDVLVNVVGGFTYEKILGSSSDTWDKMMTLNARTAYNVCRSAAPIMVAQGSGKIINVAARAGLSAGAGVAAYAAAKSAVIRLTESLAAEVKEYGVNVNCVLPGTLDTPQNRAEMPNADHARWVPLAALADVIVFLASPAARAIHGAAIPVYGRS